MRRDEKFKEMLYRAFDEGAECPYDLRSEIVDKLMRETPTEAPAIDGNELINPLLANTVASNIDEVLPATIKTYLLAGGWLAGGAVVRALMDGPGDSSVYAYSDYDIFLAKTPDYAVNFEQNNAPYDKGAVSYNYVDDGKAINVIVNPEYKTIAAVLDTFDFTLVKIGFWYQSGSPAIYCSQETWRDLSLGQIRFSKNLKEETKVSDRTKHRILKYINRGFIDCTGTMQKGFVPGILARC